jgi:hypothetical protein
MTSLTALRRNPRFDRFFWPVIWWTLNAVFREYDASNRTEFLIGVTWWGQVYVVFRGDPRPDPNTYEPLPRTFRPLTDAGWGSDLPINLDASFILPCVRWAGGIAYRAMTELALPSTPNTS